MIRLYFLVPKPRYAVRHWIVFLTAVFNVSSLEVNAQIQVISDVSSESVLVAEPFEYAIEITAPPGAQVVFSEVEATLGGFDVMEHIDRNGVPSESPPGQSIWSRRLVLESIQTGELTIPSQKIAVTWRGKSEFFWTDEEKIRVESVLENRADPLRFRDIKDAIDVELPVVRTTSNWIWWAVGGTMATVVTGLALAFLITRRRWVDANDWAISELRALPTGRLSSGECFSQLVDVLRSYLNFRFGLSKNIAKSDLIATIEYLQSPNAKDESQPASILSSIMNQAESARFAGREVSPTELNQVINTAIDFVQKCELYVSTPVKEVG